MPCNEKIRVFSLRDTQHSFKVGRHPLTQVQVRGQLLHVLFFRWCIYYTLIVCILYYSGGKENPFIYFQF